METHSNLLVEYGNFAIGFGTFALAIVLGISNWRNAAMDRKVHIANKRQDWINELRIMLSEYLSIAQEVSIRHTVSDELFRRLLIIRNKFVLMLNPEEKNSKVLITQLDKLYKGLFKEDKLSLKDFEVFKSELLETGQLILKEEWTKIKSLKE